jgi:hypothetical protein
VSGGDTAVIVIGSIAGLFMLIGLLIWLLMKRRPRLRRDTAESHEDNAGGLLVFQRQEKDGNNINELPENTLNLEAGSEALHEMHVNPAELPGSDEPMAQAQSPAEIGVESPVGSQTGTHGNE